MSSRLHYIKKLMPIKESIIEKVAKGDSLATICREYRLDPATLSNQLDSWGVRKRYSKLGNRKYTLDFSELQKETPEACYWLGFILADGCVYASTFEMYLQERDKQHLENFKSFIKYTGNIQVKNKGKYKGCRLIIRNQEFVNLLISKGIHPRKSFDKFDLYIPKHPESFLRGILDGDGSYGSYKSNSIRISCLGTKEVLELLRTHIGKGSIAHREKYNDNTWTFTTSFGIRDSNELPSWLRDTKEYYLCRKTNQLLLFCRLMEKSIGLLPSKNGEGHRLCGFCNKPVIRNLLAKFCSHSCNNKFNYKKRKEKVNTVLRVEGNTSSPV